MQPIYVLVSVTLAICHAYPQTVYVLQATSGYPNEWNENYHGYAANSDYPVNNQYRTESTRGGGEYFTNAYRDESIGRLGVSSASIPVRLYGRSNQESSDSLGSPEIRYATFSAGDGDRRGYLHSKDTTDGTQIDYPGSPGGHVNPSVPADLAVASVEVGKSVRFERNGGHRRVRQVEEREATLAYPRNPEVEADGTVKSTEGNGRTIGRVINPLKNLSQVVVVRVGNEATLTASSGGRVTFSSRDGQAASYSVQSTVYPKAYRDDGTKGKDGQESAGGDYDEHDAYPKYRFLYGVRDGRTGDVKNHWEERRGDSVRGVYSLNEPDGTIRIVEYTSDKESGFQVVVKKRE